MKNHQWFLLLAIVAALALCPTSKTPPPADSNVYLSISPDLCSGALRYKIEQLEIDLNIARGHAVRLGRIYARQEQLRLRSATAEEEYELHRGNHDTAVKEVRKIELKILELRESLKIAELWEKKK